MKIFSRGTLRDFWEKHANCEQQLKIWYRETEKSNWSSIQDLKREYPSASILKNNRIKIMRPPSRFQFSFISGQRLFFQDISNGILEYKNGTLNSLQNTTALNKTKPKVIKIT